MNNIVSNECGLKINEGVKNVLEEKCFTNEVNYHVFQ